MSGSEEKGRILQITALRASAPLEPGKRVAASDQRDTVRADIIRAAYGPEMPDPDIHRRLVNWSRAAAANSVRAIGADLRIAEAFQAARHRPTLPLQPIELEMLIQRRAQEGRAKSSIDRLVASLVKVHSLLGLPSPVDESLRLKQKELRKADTRQKGQALGLRLKGDVADLHEDEAKPLSLLKLLDSIPTDPRGLRDRALFSIGYDAGLRRSELVRVKTSHIEHLPIGEGSLFIPKSKTDQEGEGARAWLSSRSIDHLDAWLEVLTGMLSHVAAKPEWLFPSLSFHTGQTEHIAEGTVSAILKERLRTYLNHLVADGAISSNEADELVASTSAHSLRVGCDQDLFSAGVDIGAIMQGLRWTNPKQPLAYARHLAPGSSKLAAIMRKVRS